MVLRAAFYSIVWISVKHHNLKIVLIFFAAKLVDVSKTGAVTSSAIMPAQTTQVFPLPD